MQGRDSFRELAVLALLEVRRSRVALMADDRKPTRYPLEWPLGWKRTHYAMRTSSKFSKKVTSAGSAYARSVPLEVGDALDRLLGELSRLGARGAVISSNLQTRQSDGLPYAGQAKQLQDPGVAVYFTLKGAARVLACDRWRSAADNMAAIAGHIEAIRAGASQSGARLRASGAGTVTRFVDGPAAGQTLLLKRAPDFLRAVQNPKGEWDALDQLQDAPARDERIVVYQLHGEPLRAHLNFGRKGGSGFYSGGEYRVVDPQPADADVRETAAWRAWALAQQQGGDR